MQYLLPKGVRRTTDCQVGRLSMSDTMNLFINTCLFFTMNVSFFLRDGNSKKLTDDIDPKQEVALYEDVCQIIDCTRGRIASYVNTEVCLTNWYVGKRIKEDVLNNKRAEYGRKVIKNLSIKLIERYGSGWSEKTLRHCLRAAETFSENDIVSAVQRQFSWTHLKEIMYISDPLVRQFYMQMCQYEHCRRGESTIFFVDMDTLPYTAHK